MRNKKVPVICITCDELVEIDESELDDMEGLGFVCGDCAANEENYVLRGEDEEGY